MNFGKKEENEEGLPINSEEVTPAEEIPSTGESADFVARPVDTDPIDIELESEDDEKSDGALSDKLKKLRAELEKCKKEKQEYLIGWQRCKADSINARKEAIVVAERAGNRSRDTLVEDIIPALDSFDMAIASDSWASMDANWRTGMENVRSQLITALQNQGVQFFGNVGDVLDHSVHEAVEEVEAKGTPGTITRVLRKGYRLSGRDGEGGRILRPAQVAVIAHPQENI